MELASKLTEHTAPRDLTARPTPEELCERYAQRVHQFAAMVSGNAAEAEDLAQEALIKAITRLDRYDPARGDLEAWLWRIVTNTARDAGRMARRRQNLLQRLLSTAPEAPVTTPDIATIIPDDDLLAAIRDLDKRSRSVIALRFGADLDYAGVGTALGISPAAARMATQRALAALRRRLEKGNK